MGLRRLPARRAGTTRVDRLPAGSQRPLLGGRRSSDRLLSFGTVFGDVTSRRTFDARSHRYRAPFGTIGREEHQCLRARSANLAKTVGEGSDRVSTGLTKNVSAYPASLAPRRVNAPWCLPTMSLTRRLAPDFSSAVRTRGDGYVAGGRVKIVRGLGRRRTSGQCRCPIARRDRGRETLGR